MAYLAEKGSAFGRFAGRGGCNALEELPALLSGRIGTAMMGRMVSPFYKPHPKRWWQFSLRAFFVLITLLGVTLGWLGVQVQWIHNRREAFKWTPDAPEGMPYLVGEDGHSAPLSIGLLGAPGFFVVFVVVADEEHPTEQDRAAMRNAELLFPEADVLYSEGVGVSTTPIGTVHGGGGFF